MTAKEDLFKHLKVISEIYNKWPAWKKGWLKNSNKSTFDTPRPPVIKNKDK